MTYIPRDMRTSLDSCLSQTGIAEVREWLRGSLAGAPAVAVASAPTGSGLTCTMALVLRELDAEPVWVSFGGLRRAFLADACGSRVAVSGRAKVLVVDEFDALAADAAAWAELSPWLRTPRLTVLCLARASRSARVADLTKGYARFVFRAPPAPAIARVLLAAAPGDALEAARLAAAARGDVRAALAAWRMAGPRAEPAEPAEPDEPDRDEPAEPDEPVEPGAPPARRRPDATEWLRDDRPEGLDSVQALLDAEVPLDAALRAYASDPGIVSMGLWENYLRVSRSVSPGVSEAFSIADVVDTAMYARQTWALGDVHGAIAVGGAALLIDRDPAAEFAVEKFGTIWSRGYNQCAKTKNVRAVALARAEAGLGGLPVTDLAFVRGLLAAAVESGDAGRIRAAAAGVGGQSAAVLCAMRLWDSKYRQSQHARVKKMLD